MKNKLSVKDWLYMALAVGGMVYGYGALQTRVSALEQDVSHFTSIKEDIAVIRTKVENIEKRLP